MAGATAQTGLPSKRLKAGHTVGVERNTHMHMTWQPCFYSASVLASHLAYIAIKSDTLEAFAVSEMQFVKQFKLLCTIRVQGAGCTSFKFKCKNSSKETYFKTGSEL